MGRHRRSAADRAATGRAAGVTETGGSYPGSYDPPQHSYAYDPPQTSGSGGSPDMGTAPFLDTEAYAEASARSAAYLFAGEDDFATVFPEHGFTPDGGARRGGNHRRRRQRAVTSVRSGLLGVSAAVALGTVAVTTGAVPGLDNYKLGGSSSGDKAQAAGSPTNSASEQGGTSGSADSRSAGGSSTSRSTGRTASPSSPAPSTSTAAPGEAPTTKRPKPKPEPGRTEKPKTTPSKKQTSKPAETAAPAVTVSAATAAEAEVLRLVNDERAKVGCSALAANSSLGELAGDFSDAMAEEGFFDHTDPSGATPWDRAAKLGISSLGGENIARGQTDPAAVMSAWMNSPGHRANILNCDFKTLGVGVHLGSGGPWWTQDFGY